MQNALDDVPLFQGLPDDLRHTLASVAEERTVEDGAVIFREGDPGDAWFVVAAGEVRIVRDVGLEDGGTILLTTLGAGSSFGEISVFDESPRSASAIARGAVRLVAIGRDALKGLLAERPADVARLLVTIIGTLSSTVRRATNDLVTVYETGKIAGTVRDPAELSLRILEKVHGAVGADRSALGIWDPYIEDYGWTAVGADGSLPGTERVAPLIERAFEAPEGVLVEHDEAARAADPWFGAASVVVPIWSEAEGLGVLLCTCDEEGGFGLDQQRLADVVALQVGGAIAIARHEQELRDRERLERAREGFETTL